MTVENGKQVERPQHGDMRNRESVIDTDPATKRILRYTIEDRWCEVCGGVWVKSVGILGSILCSECLTPWHEDYLPFTIPAEDMIDGVAI